MFPVFYQIMQEYEGVAVPMDHRYGKVSFMTEAECLEAIAQRPHPELYFCLRYESTKTTAPQAKPKADPMNEKPLDIAPPATPKRVAQQPRHEQQAMLSGNPIRGLFNW
jgi:hypothetical protein